MSGKTLDDLLAGTLRIPYEDLRDGLALEASRRGMLDVAYRVVDSPVGSLLLAATEEGLVRLAFEQQDHDAALEELAEKVSPRVLRSPARLDDVARELEEYFAGRRTEFDVRLDLTLTSGFRRIVVEVLQGIEFGHTRSYAEVAQEAGSPRAVRAVGTACARNPVPVVVPCHRVVRSDGSAGQYAGGAETKSRLLRMESGDRLE
jgi:methylated-DNA-[protein]-cysteine S-methyltransferase